MTTQIYYLYDPFDGALGCHVCATEAQMAGVTHATLLEPPPAPAGSIAVFTAEQTWAVVPDHRRQIWHNPATREQMTIAHAGQTPPVGWVQGPPPPDLNAELAAAKAAACDRINKLSLSRKLQPITVDGVTLDAHEEALSNMGYTRMRLLEGRGLPSNWIGWKTFDNSLVHENSGPLTVATWLQTVSNAIEERWQALLIARWQHKAAIDAMTSIQEVHIYMQQLSWPE